MKINLPRLLAVCSTVAPTRLDSETRFIRLSVICLPHIFNTAGKGNWPTKQQLMSTKHIDVTYSPNILICVKSEHVFLIL